MKKILSVALSTAMAFSMFASVAFGETATTPQAKFDALAAKGILNGYPDGQAHLEKDLTRAEFAKIVTKLFGLTEVTGKLSYKDKGYTATNWAVPYIEAVTAANLMQGKDTVKGIFDYNGKVTVEEVAAVLFRALKLETPATTDNSASAWAKGYAQAVINAGLVAQGTNFKANATRSLVVEAAYAVDNLHAVPTVASAEALSPTSVFVTFSDKTTTTVTLTTALVAGVETTINFKNNGHDYTAKVTLAAPKVVSVTAPNAKQLVVKFNRAIDSASISETKANVTSLVDGYVAINALTGAEGITQAQFDDSNIVLAADGTEAWITLPGNAFLKGQYGVTVTKNIKTTAGEEIAAYTTLVNVADTAAPTITSVTATARATTDKVIVKFSEPVKDLGVIAYVNGGTASVARGSSLSELVLSNFTLESGKTYNVSFLNVQDYAGNFISPNPTATTVTVVSDVTAPTISSVTVTGDKTAKVVFSKDVDINTLYGNVELLNSTGENIGDFTVAAGSDKKTYTITAPGTMSFSNGVFNGTVLFKAGIRDTLGNTLASATTQAITFNRDTTAPTVASATYGSTGLTVKFSEDVDVIVGSKFNLINDATGNSREITVTTDTYSASGSSVLFKNVTGFAAGTYTLRLNAGVVQDKSAQANKNAASVHSVTIAATSSTDTTKPAVTVIPTGAVEVPGGTDQVITFTVSDASGLNLTTVRDVNNYTLDGKALPTGAYITTNYSSTSPASTPVEVKVFVPTSGISASKNTGVFVINGIQDTAGNVINPFVQSDIALVDGVAPVLSSGVVSSDESTRVILTFSEKVTNVKASDFTFKINGVTAPDSAVTITPSSDQTKFFVTFTAQKKDSALFFDKDGDGVVDSDEYIATTSDNGGIINLNSVYINTINVTVDSDATLTDLSAKSNKVTTGTVVNIKGN